MRLFLLRVYLFYCFAVFLTVMVVASPLMALPILLAGERGRWLSYQGFRLWGSSFWLMGLRFAVRGRANIPTSGAVLYVVNHQSLLDTPAVYWAVRRPLKTLAKVELTRFFFFGYLIKIATVVVDRAKAGSRTASLAALAREFAAGRCVMIFPEGRMNPTHDTIKPFAEASIAVAMRQGAAIVPIALKGSGPLLPTTPPFLIHPGRIEVHVLPGWTAEQYAGQEAGVVTEGIRVRMAGVLGFGVEG